MQFKSFALLAVASTGAAAQQLSLPTDPAFQSLLGVLATAIPASVQSLAFASPAALVSQLQSSLSAGNTPSWYAALPTDVKSALPSLFPAATPVTTTPAATSSVVVTATATLTSEVVSGTGTISNIRNSTTISTVRSATLSVPTETETEVTETSSSSGGASYPTAVFGAGVAGAIGVLGMLAL